MFLRKIYLFGCLGNLFRYLNVNIFEWVRTQTFQYGSRLKPSRDFTVNTKGEIDSEFQKLIYSEFQKLIAIETARPNQILDVFIKLN